MADVFISYARTERDEAERMKERLEAMGLSVFLDVDGLDGGDVFSDKLDREVKTAGCVLGLWSPTSLTRPWVQTECDIGKRRGVLVPVAIHPFRDMDVPAPFWNIQFVDLTDLSDDPDDPNWLKLRRALARTLQRPEIAPARAPRPSAAPVAGTTPAASRKSASTLPAVLAGLVVLLLAGAGGFWVLDPLHLHTPALAAALPAPASSSPATSPTPGATASPAAVSASPATPSSTPSASPDTSPVPGPPLSGATAAPTPAIAAPRPSPSQPARPKERFRAEQQFILTHAAGVSWLDWSPDGSKIVTVTVDATPHVWDANSGAQLFALSGHTSQVSRGVFSPDSSRIFTSSADKTVRIWNASNGAPIQSIDTNNPLWGVALSRDGARFLAWTPNGNSGLLWDARTNTFLGVLFSNNDLVNSLTFSPDGSKVLIASDDKRARVFDIATKAFGMSLNMPASPWSAVWSPDGSRIATGAAEGRVDIWDASTGALLMTMTGKGKIRSVDYSRDGTRISTASWSGDTRIWNATTGELLCTIVAPAEYYDLNRAAFSPDGSRVAVASYSGKVRIWRLVPN